MSKMSTFSLKNLKDRKPKKKPPSEREISAYHEAGHVVLSVACQWPVKSVTIAPRTIEGDHPHAGKFTPAARSKFIFVSLGFTDVRYGGGQLADLRDDRVRFLRWSLSALAGAIAEGERLGPDGDTTQPQSNDLMEFGQQCRHIFGFNFDGEPLIELTMKLTMYYWPQITAVAEALLRQETLSESEIDSLLVEMPRLDLTEEAAKLKVSP